MKKLYRSRTNRMIFGVCGGIGKYFGIDPIFIRILFLILAIPTLGFSSVLYILMAIIIPQDPSRPNKNTFTNTKMYTRGSKQRDIKEAEKVDDDK